MACQAERLVKLNRARPIPAGKLPVIGNLAAAALLYRHAAQTTDNRESVKLINLSETRVPLAHVGRVTEEAATQVLNLVDAAQPAGHAASSEAMALATRLQAAALHPALGIGEARAALAEAADALCQQAALWQASQGLTS